MPRVVPPKSVTSTPNTLYEHVHFSTSSLTSCQCLNLMGEKHSTSVTCYSLPVAEEDEHALLRGRLHFFFYKLSGYVF